MNSQSLKIILLLIFNYIIAQHPMQRWGLDNQGGLIGIGYNPLSFLPREVLQVNPYNAEITNLNNFYFDGGDLGGYWHEGMMVTDPDSGYIYGLSFDMGMHRIKMDGSSVEKTGIVSMNVQNWGLDGQGGLIGIGYDESTQQNYIIQVNVSTGVATKILSFYFVNSCWHPWMMVTDPKNGYIYANDCNAQLYRLKMDGSEVKKIGYLNEYFQQWGMDDKGGLIGIGYNETSGMNEIRQVNINTAEVTTIKSFAFNTGWWHPEFMVTNPDSGLIWAMSFDGDTEDHYLYKIQMDGSKVENIGQLKQVSLSVEDDQFTPTAFALEQNYPNPFNPTTTIRYEIPENSFVKVIVYNMLGQAVRILENSYQTAGSKILYWDAINDQGVSLPGGIYLYAIQAGEFHQTKKMVLLK